MLRVDYIPPKRYVNDIAMFDDKGRVTSRVITGLDNVLDAYTRIAEIRAREKHTDLSGYDIDKVYIVGSGARSNRIDSDMDLLLIAPRIDDESAKKIRLMLLMLYFTNRPKTKAIDVFIARETDPKKAKIDITHQVQEILKKYRQMLSKR